MTEIKAKIVEFDLVPHPNADVLSIALIRGTGWQCVVKTSDMVGKTLGVYIPIDAEVPLNRDEFKFLASKTKNKRYRIRTIRLRGSLSQGLLLPMPEGAKLGDDLTEEWGVTRWEPVVPTILSGDMIRDPGNFQKYTSIENWKNFPNIFLEGDIVRITEKIHGCLQAGTRIKLASGDKKTICQIKIGDEVLGLDADHNLVPTKVLRVFKNGQTNDWLNVQIKVKNTIKTIKCTPNHEFWIPSKNNYVSAEYLKSGDKVSTYIKLPNNGKLGLIEQEVIAITKYKLKCTKYDIETETHNYFANGILVHNSNSRYGYVDDGGVEGLRFFVGTHRTARSTSGKNLYSTVARNLSLENKISSLVKIANPKIHFIVYGEIYGSGIQDLAYGCSTNEHQFRIFDVSIDHKYQNWEFIQHVADTLGVPTVPLLYRGPWSVDQALAFRDGLTTLSGSHVREGVVVTADPESTHPKIGRKIIKIISDDYLLRKNSTDGH